MDMNLVNLVILVSMVILVILANLVILVIMVNLVILATYLLESDTKKSDSEMIGQNTIWTKD